MRADAPVHHVARRDDVGAGARLGDGGAREQLERRVVVDAAVGAQAGRSGRGSVYSHRQTSVMTSSVGVRVLDRARGELDDALVVPGARALLVLVGGDAEEQDGRDAERVGLARLLDGARDRRAGRRRASRRSACGPRGRPRRTAAGRGPPASSARLAHEVAQRTGAAQAAQAGGGKGSGPDIDRRKLDAERPREPLRAPHGASQSSIVSAKMSWSSQLPVDLQVASARGPPGGSPPSRPRGSSATLRGMIAGCTRCRPAWSKANAQISSAPPRVPAALARRESLSTQ